MTRAGLGWVRIGTISVSPFAGLGDGDALPLEVLTQTVVEFGQAAQLQVGHGLLVLLDLGRVADVTGGVLRHIGVGGVIVSHQGWIGLATIYIGELGARGV